MKNKTKGRNKIILLLLALVLFLPTLSLIVKFFQEFLGGLEVSYGGSFWIGVCGCFASMAVFGLFQYLRGGKEEVAAAIPEEKKKMSKEQFGVIKRTVINTVQIFGIKSLLIVVVMVLIRIVGMPTEVVWLGFVGLLILSIIQIVQGSFTGLPGVLNVYTDYFWLTFAWAHGIGAFVIWAIVRFAALVALGGLPLYFGKYLVEDEDDEDDYDDGEDV